jgi:antitoxin VapB
MPRVTAKLFRNGRSQAVRLPKESRFAGNEVYVEKHGDTLVLTPKQRAWSLFFSEVPLPSEDLLKTREDLPPQRRDALL